MGAKTYYEKFGREASERVALAAGTKLGYFLQIANGHRRPSPELAQALVDASDNRFDFALLLKPKAVA